MSARATPAALALTLTMALAGCFDSHVLGASSDAGPPDGPLLLDAGEPRDAPGPDTAPMLDAGRQLCRLTGPGRIDGDLPVSDPSTLRFSVVNIHGTALCPTTFTFLLVGEAIVDPHAWPAPRIELEATVETDVVDAPFEGSADGTARAIGATGAVVAEADATLRIDAEQVEFGPGGLIEGEASVNFGVPSWSAMGDAEAPYCSASICL